MSALLVGGVLASAGCSEPISLSCPPGTGDVIVVDNRLQGRWSVEGRSPQLSEEWRRNLPEEFMAATPEVEG